MLGPPYACTQNRKSQSIGHTNHECPFEPLKAKARAGRQKGRHLALDSCPPSVFRIRCTQRSVNTTFSRVFSVVFERCTIFMDNMTHPVVVENDRKTMKNGEVN